MSIGYNGLASRLSSGFLLRCRLLDAAHDSADDILFGYVRVVADGVLSNSMCFILAGVKSLQTLKTIEHMPQM